MSKSDFIQLREAESVTRSDTNGTYSTILERPLKLENNDVLSINSVFVDTRSPATGRIEVNENNNDFELSFGYYITNGFANADFVYTDESAPTNRNIPKPDGKKYILAFADTGDNDLLNLTQFGFTGQAGSTVAVDITFQFTPAHAGLPSTIVLHCPKQDPSDGIVRLQMPKNKGTANFDLEGIILKATNPPNFSDDDFVPIAPTKDGETCSNTLTDFFLITNPNGSDQGAPYQHEATPTNIDDTLIPLVNKFQFTIPANSYTPDSLAKLITDKMIAFSHASPSQNVFTVDTSTVKKTSGFATKNAFFTSFKQLQTDNSYGLAAPAIGEFYLVSEDGQTVLQVARDSVNNYIIGAAQMALQFDDTLNKFLFTQIHTNLFDNQGNPIIKYIQTSAVPALFTLQGAHSGVYLTATNQSTHNLLFDSMGFDSSLLVPPFTPTVSKTFGGALLNSKVFTMDLEEGVNITSNRTDSDAGLVKDDTFKVAPNPTLLQDINSVEVNSIIGSNNQKASQLSEGYFLVEIGGIPNNSLINSVNNQISCIVSKYQATEDFTIVSDKSGAIQYVHNGEPLMITKLDVRILDPNGRAAEEIGNNNTVFLELIKNN